jgi:hypothetical protein
MDDDSLPHNHAFTALNLAEAATLDALFEQLFPADEVGPGASSIGVIAYLDRALSGAYARHLETYRGLPDRGALEAFTAGKQSPGR